MAFLASSTSGAATLEVVGGELAGASGVDVAGTLYDVVFTDGSCLSLFDGCDDPGDFTFTSLSGALAASQALVDQVFVGAFDLDPELMAGCEDLNFCIIDTPYVGDGSLFSSGRAQNTPPDLQPDVSYFQENTSVTVDFSIAPANTFAVWTVVPEPSAVALVSFGLAALAVSHRSRNGRSRRPTRRCS